MLYPQLMRGAGFAASGITKVFHADQGPDQIIYVDVTDPSAMVEVVPTGTVARIRGLAIDTTRDLAFVGTVFADDIYCVDISNPDAPSSLSTLGPNSTLYSESCIPFVDIANERVLWKSRSRLSFIDYSTPGSITVTGANAQYGNVSSDSDCGVFDAGRQLFFASNSTTACAIDLSNPSAIADNTYTDTVSLSQQSIISALDPVNGVAYGRSVFNNYVVSVDVSDETALAELDAFDLGTTFFGAERIYKDPKRDFLYAACPDYLVVLNVSDPSNIAVEGSVAAANIDAEGIIYDDRAEIVYTNKSNEMVSFDVSDPTTPVELDRVSLGGSLNDTLPCSDLAGPTSSRAFGV